MQTSLFIHFIEGKIRFNVIQRSQIRSQHFISHTGQYKTYPVSRRLPIFLDKSLPLPNLSRRIEGPLLTGYMKRGLRTADHGLRTWCKTWTRYNTICKVDRLQIIVVAKKNNLRVPTVHQQDVSYLYEHGPKGSAWVLSFLIRR